MPYRTNASLPIRVKDNLPSKAQIIFRKAYNNAYKQYRDPKKRRGKATLTETCNKVAWAAVKNEYQKKGDKWIKK